MLIVITKMHTECVHGHYIIHMSSYPTFLSEEINISANSMKITSDKVSSVTAQPGAHSLFHEWFEAMILMPLCTKAQSMGVNGCDMQCNVR